MRVPTLVAALAVTSAVYVMPAFGQECLHGPKETAVEKQRRETALGLARRINTGEAAFFARERRYGSLAEIADVVRQHYPGAPLIASTGDVQNVPGFDVKLLTTADSYVFSIKDATDGCRFAYFSDRDGIVFQSYPIGSRAWTVTAEPKAPPDAPKIPDR